jgi:hypothetical protein
LVIEIVKVNADANDVKQAAIKRTDSPKTLKGLIFRLEPDNWHMLL